MRGILGFVVLLVAIVGLFAFVVVPLAAPGLVSAAVRGTPPLAGQEVAVTAEVGPADLLRGEISRIVITGQTVRIGSSTAAGVSVLVDDLSILDRSFGNVSGQAASVTVNEPDGTRVELSDVRLAGNSKRLLAVGVIGADEVGRLLTVRLSLAGVPVDAVRLEPGVIVLTVAGQEVQGRLSIVGNTVVLTPAAGLPPAVVSTGIPAPWQLIALDVTPTGITVQAELAGARLG